MMTSLGAALDAAETTPLEAHQAIMSWPDPQEGDVRKIWDRHNQDEVNDARRSFNDLLAKGYSAFHVKGEKGDRGERMDRFDPAAERMVLIPPMKGGR